MGLENQQVVEQPAAAREAETRREGEPTGDAATRERSEQLATSRQAREQNGPLNPESAAREKTASGAADAIKSGSSSDLESQLKNAYGAAQGDPAKFKEFGDKLGEKLKESGIKVDTKDSSISFEKNGQSIKYDLSNPNVDFKEGQPSAEAKVSTSNGADAASVLAGFQQDGAKVAIQPEEQMAKGPQVGEAPPVAEGSRRVGSPEVLVVSQARAAEAAVGTAGEVQRRADQPAAERKPVDILKDKNASAEQKLVAANEMAAKGEKSFVGDDGRKYQITSEKYGDRQGVVVATTEHGKFMPVLRGIVATDGSVSHQTDRRTGKEVDYAGTNASKYLKDSTVLATGKAEAPTGPEADPKPAKRENAHSEGDPKVVAPRKPGDATDPKPDGDRTVPNQSEVLKKGPLGTDFKPVDKPQPEAKTVASVYGAPQPTSSGRYFDPREMTAAFNPDHLPPGLNLKNGDVIRVTRNGKSVDVTLTDKGPNGRDLADRGLDLSTAAGRALGITVGGIGTDTVTLQKIGSEPGFKSAPKIDSSTAPSQHRRRRR